MDWLFLTNFFLEVFFIKQELPINGQIREKEVQVIDENGQKLGVMQTKDAIEVAEEKNLDLVLVAPNGNPPVCKIMNYGKYKFEQAKKEALENNYSVQQAKHLLESKSYDVKTNTGDLLPSINVNANATRGTEESRVTKDPTTNSAYVGVSLDVPLYTGGASRAKIRQSKYEKWQAQELVQQAERAAISGVTSSWEYMNANKAKIESVKDQIKAYEVALDGVQKEESLGNRTVLDVLDAYQDLLNSQVEEVSALRDYYVSGLQMLSSVGKLTAENLKLDVELYQPKKYYKETRDKWLSISVDE